VLVDSRRRTIPDNSEEQVTRDCTEGEQNRRIAAENLRKRALGKPRNGKAFEPQVPTKKHRAQDGGRETETAGTQNPAKRPESEIRGLPYGLLPDLPGSGVASMD
jgi:hypothetical protein